MTSSSRSPTDLSLSNKPSAAGSDNELRLFCKILGGPNTFSVKIKKSETVGDLKEAIKKKKTPELDHIVVDTLSVWKLSPPIPSAEIDAKLGRVKRPEEIPGCVKLHTLAEMSQLFESPLSHHLHIVGEVPSTSSREHSRFKSILPSRKWAVDGPIRGVDKVGCYYLDLGTQDETKHCLDMIATRKFVLLWGSRASGKTTRLFWLQKELLSMGYQALYVSLERMAYCNGIDAFWQSLGNAVHRAASVIDLEFPPRTSCRDDFLNHFDPKSLKQNIVLIIDDLNELYHAEPAIQDDCLRCFREIKSNSEAYAIHSIIAAGTFGIVNIKNPYFTLQGTRDLFRVFALDNHVSIDDAVIEDIWAKSNGHPAMVSLCGRTIFNKLLSLIDDSANLSYRSWQQFPASELYNEISRYDAFGSMLNSLSRPEAKASVTLLRSRFLGFLDEVVLHDRVQQELGNFLTSEGVLLKPHPANPRYYMASPLVDGLIRNTLIPSLFPDCPSSAPPLQDEGKGLHVLRTLIESLRFFDKTLIHIGASLSYKTSKVRIASVPGGHVPRESVYDTELLRILSSWLRNRHNWTIIGQWHLQNDNRYSDIVIKNQEHPGIILELLATGDPDFVKSRIEKTPEHMALLSATEAWVVHFTCEQDYRPVWQSDVELSAGINVVHFAHDVEFKNVVMSTRWKDHAGIVHQEDGRLLVV